MSETICALVHGGGGMGKSWLGQSTPAPRLVLDAEGGSRRPWRAIDGVGVRQRKVEWNPMRDNPPEYDGSWDTCEVIVREYAYVDKVYQWLNSGKHPFKSVVLDSLTEIQKKCKDVIGGVDSLRIQDWDLMMIRMESLVRSFRDLVFHPTNPLDAVIILALTKVDNKDETHKPAVQGQLGISLPGYVDVEGYLFVAVHEETGVEERKLLIVPRVGYEAKDRTHTLSQHYGPSITNPDIEAMLAVLNEEGEAA